MKRAAALTIALAAAGCNSNTAGFNLMDRAITWSDIAKIGVGLAAIAIVGGVVIYFVVTFGRGMSR